MFGIFKSRYNIPLFLFILALFLFKIPNFYLIPFIKNSFMTTQAVARILIIMVFLGVILIGISSQRPLWDPKKNPTIFLILVFFCLQSISIIPAINVGSFLNRYKDVVISLIFFFVSLHFKKYQKSIIVVFIAAAIFNIVYQSGLVFFPSAFIPILSELVYQKHWDLVMMNVNRGRILIDVYDEVLIPFLILGFTKSSRITDTLYATIGAGIAVFAFLSNFRTRLFMLFGGVLSSLVAAKKISVQVVLFCIFIVMIGYYANTFSLSTFGFSFYDRLNLNEAENTQPLSWRTIQIKESIEMGNKNILGVGLGNYFDNLPIYEKRYSPTDKWTEIANQGAVEYVHNVFGIILAESGYITLLVFLILNTMFLKSDAVVLFQKESKNNLVKSYVIAYWILFFYGLFNPIVPASYQILLWTIRGILV